MLSQTLSHFPPFYTIEWQRHPAILTKIIKFIPFICFPCMETPLQTTMKRKKNIKNKNVWLAMLTTPPPAIWTSTLSPSFKWPTSNKIW